MRVLVTGGCGFIGTNLCEYFLDQGGYFLRVLDNLSTGRREYLVRISERGGGKVDFVEGDIRDPGVVNQVTHDVDAVVHLAAQTSVVESLDSPQEAFQVNVMGTLNLLEACRYHGVQRLVFASSNAVLGEQNPPIHEQMVPKPISPYGASKLACEGLCSAYHASFGIKAIALRFSNVYGPYCEHKASAIPEFIRRARRGESLVIYGDGSQTRDFINVQDVCRAIELGLHHEADPEDQGRVFQIGTGKPIAILELAEIIRNLVRDSGECPHIELQNPRSGEIIANYSDITRAREKLGFEPQVGLKEGLRELWESLSSRP